LFDFVGWIQSGRDVPLTAGTLRGYIGTIRKRLGVIHGWKYPNSTILDAYLEATAKLPPDPAHPRREPRLPCTKRLIALVSADPTIDIAIRTAILVAWECMLRSREYVSERALGRPDPIATLCGQHVRTIEAGDGIALRIVHSKSDRNNEGSSMFFFRRNDSHCPVAAITEYVRQRPSAVLHNEAFFRKVVAGGRVSNVTRTDINNALQRHASAAGLDPARVTSHSIRIGAAWEMANAGVSWQHIQVRGRWSGETISAMTVMYARMSKERILTGSAALNVDNAAVSASTPLYFGPMLLGAA